LPWRTRTDMRPRGVEVSAPETKSTCLISTQAGAFY